MAPQRLSLLITPQILRAIKRVWSASAMLSDTKMVWNACCLVLFVFLRAGEMTVPDNDSYDPSIHLSVGDIAVDHWCRPTFIRLTIKQSKTDTFRKSMDLFVGHTGEETCPMAALLSDLACRGTRPGPLFIVSDIRPLMCRKFVDLVRGACRHQCQPAEIL